MTRLALPIVLPFAICSISACATKVVVFKTNGPAKVDMLVSGKLDQPADSLGDTPVTVDLERLRGKIVRISQPGKTPVYWVAADTAGDTTEANINLANDPTAAAASGEPRADAKTSSNRVMRLLLKSYQALSGKRFAAARELADQAATINPEIAAPQVIKGLALFQEGKADEAKTALLKAQALDPEDRDIEELLKVVQQ